MVPLVLRSRIHTTYLTALTLFVCGAVVWDHAHFAKARAFDEITVHRINVVEQDGTVRMVIANRTSAPGVFVRNKEFAHDDRKAAGLLFFDEEGTESGGLIYSVLRDANGAIIGTNSYLSFDQYMQDQIFAVNAGRNGPTK